MKKEFIISKSEVKNLAKEILPKIIERKILCLTGDLGAGKTFFSSEIIKLLTENEIQNITSPTFNIVNVYNISNEKSIHHFDLYRLKTPEELENVGFFESLDEGICIIEWPEIAKNFLKNAFYVDISYIENKNKRKFTTYG